jgi:hypothetical protein
MNDFIHEYECSNGKIDQTSISWVLSVVVIQYALGKLVYFRGQNNFPGIYRFIDDFLSAYLTKFLNYTIRDSCDRDWRMINMMTVRDTMISFSSIKDMLTGDRKTMFKVLVLFKRTLYKLSRMTTTYTKIWTRPQEFTNLTVILNVRCQQYR